MRLSFVTPHVTPYGAPSPIGDACAALPKALVGRGHEILVVAPLHADIDPLAKGLGRRLKKVEVEAAGETVSFAVFEARTAAGVELVFLGHEELFGASPSASDAVRFGLFTRAAVDVIQRREGGVDAMHAHGASAALAPVWADRLDLDLGTVLTVYDVDDLGPLSASDRDRLGLDDLRDERAVIAGARAADRVTTISASYAGELAAGGPLAAVLGSREDELVGVVGGVDAAVWNPATDSHLEARFDPMDRSGKLRCKSAAQQALELPVRDDVPLVVAFGPITKDAGLDALARVIARLMRSDVQLAVVGEEGTEEADLVGVLREHQQRWPDRMSVTTDADHVAIHRILGAADLVVVPPTQPAGGSAQLRALRYGALPIGPRRGSVEDTVVDCDASLTTGTGFLYAPGDDAELLGALQRAVAAFSDRAAFERVRGQAMRADQGWERAAYLYERLYAGL